MSDDIIPMGTFGSRLHNGIFEGHNGIFEGTETSWKNNLIALGIPVDTIEKIASIWHLHHLRFWGEVESSMVATNSSTSTIWGLVCKFMAGLKSHARYKHQNWRMLLGPHVSKSKAKSIICVCMCVCVCKIQIYWFLYIILFIRVYWFVLKRITFFSHKFQFNCKSQSIFRD